MGIKRAILNAIKEAKQNDGNLATLGTGGYRHVRAQLERDAALNYPVTPNSTTDLRF